MPKDTPISYRDDGTPIFDNTESVVCVAAHDTNGEILIMQRASGLGKGQWAFPGGYQMKGQTWQEAAIAEVMEETGVDISHCTLTLDGLITSTVTWVNLLFISWDLPAIQTDADTDGESLDHAFVPLGNLECVDWAFDSHREFARTLVS